MTHKLFSALGRTACEAAALFCALAVPFAAHAQTSITADNWGSVTAPVYGSSETVNNGLYASAELFAGPNKLGSYFSGVLPNGRKVTPAGLSVQVGMNPLGTMLTPDGKYLIISNDDERDGGFASLQSGVNKGGYSLTVLRTADMSIVSQLAAGSLFIGLAVKANANGGYTVYASGGPGTYATTNGTPTSMNLGVVKVFALSGTGAITAAPTPTIAISPITPRNQGFVSNYALGANNTFTNPANFFAPSPGSSTNPAIFTAGAQITFPAGLALSPASIDGGRYLYVACNGDNSLAVIDTTTSRVVKQIPVGYFPYGVSVSADGTKVMVSNWGVTQYKFKAPKYDASGGLLSLGTTGQNQPDGFYVPVTSTTGAAPATSSVSVVSVPGGNPANASSLGAVYQGQPGGLSANDTEGAVGSVGETHPSATAIVRRGATEVLYVAKANNDSLGLILVRNNRRLPDFDLSPLGLTLSDGHAVHGAYPNALALSADNTRLYVAEAGINSVAVLNVSNPTAPQLLGRIPTGWYPTALAVSADGRTLYVANAKGVGEDINPATDKTANPTATGIESYTDGNFIFGTAQKIDLTTLNLNTSTQAALANNFAINTPADTTVVPQGGAASGKIKHVVFILHENKTFDSMLGNLGAHFGPYASLTYNNTGTTTAPNGTAFTNGQFTGVSLNTQLLAQTFATGVNYYSDSEESDAGHQFSASGTASDYTEKTLLVKTGRGLLVNKNFEPEDYPEGGYIFNNAARNGVSFKDYGAMVRIDGTDTGNSTPTTLNDPNSGNLGYPLLKSDGFTVQTDANGKVVNAGDTNTATSGLGQSYFMSLPILSVLGTTNPNGAARLDKNYPGYNFNISDQRRALEFNADFDKMAKAGTLPTYLYIYQPNDHTGGVVAPNAGTVGKSPVQQVADGDVGLGMVVDHIMKATDNNGHGIYYNDPAIKGTDGNAGDGTGTAIFITYDDAQSSLDHIHQHRTPLVVVSPYARVAPNGQGGTTGYVGTRHYVTASVVKTEELLMGLPPNNLGDLFATDLRDLFQDSYNGITEASLASKYTRNAKYTPSPEGKHVWALVAKLDTSAPDRDSERLGILTRLSMQADALHVAAVQKRHLHAAQYKTAQAHLYQMALQLTSAAAPRRDSDD